MDRNDIQTLIDASLKLVEKLLVEQNGEFFPFGGSVSVDGEYSMVGYFDGEDLPESQHVINQLKSSFKSGIELGEIRAYSITYDALVKQDESSDKTDAVVIHTYLIEDGQYRTYYYPYEISANETVVFGDPWGVLEI